MGKKFVIGDIHGSAKGLKQIFEKSGFDFEKDKAIFLGDICDGWSQVKECMDFIMTIPNKEVIMGNHDEWALYFFTNKDHYANNSVDTEYLSWKSQGGWATIQSLTKDGVVEQKYIDFLQNLKYFHEEDGNLFVHAGYDMMAIMDDIHISKQHSYSLCWDRSLIRTAYEYRKDSEFSLNSPWKEIFVGHTPTISFNDFYKTPQNWLNLWAVDTGAAFTGKLSMMNIETKELFQSDECRRLYPDEAGRNKKSFNLER